MTERNLGQHITWWVGKVVNVNDPQQSGRVQIRMYGLHDDPLNIPDNTLPWALPLQPIDSAAFGKIGSSPVGLVKGSNVIGFWSDVDQQYPIILGSFGKAGDQIAGVYQNGAPAINTSSGSIPAAAKGIDNNPRTYLFSGRTALEAIDSGVSYIGSTLDSVGVAIANTVESDMKFPKLPTIASADKNDTTDVNEMSISIDPLSLSASIPCLNISFNLLKDLLTFVGALANEFKDLIVSAIVNAILTLAQKLGIFKIIGLLQAATAIMSEVQDLLNVLNISICGKNIINQGVFDDTNYLIASTMHSLNNITSSVQNAPGNLAGVAGGTVNNVFDNLVQKPLASVPTATSPVPDNIVERGDVPANYTQSYSSSDPYPGYIKWTDPNGVNKDVYTLRNGEPNYISAQQHIFFNTQDNFIQSFEQQLLTGVVTSTSLTSIFGGVLASSRAFALTKFIGQGFEIAGLIAGAALFVPLIGNSIENTFSSNIGKSTVTNVGNVNSSVNKFIQNQSMLSMKKQSMMAGLNKNGN